MLKGKVILVSGSSRGIGAEVAKVLASHRAIVIINYDKNVSAAGNVLNSIKKDSPESIIIKADVSRKADTDKMMKNIVNSFGRIDGVVNNASGPLSYKQFLSVETIDFQRNMDVIFFGAINIIKSALPYMMKLKNCRIVNVLSSATIGAPPSKPIDYIAAKYALFGLSKALAVDLGPSGITVNCVSPGMTETDMIAALPEKMKEMAAYQTPMKRLAHPQDIAGLIAFLCSDSAGFITGANIPVAGGSVM